MLDSLVLVKCNKVETVLYGGELIVWCDVVLGRFPYCGSWFISSATSACKSAMVLHNALIGAALWCDVVPQCC